MLNGFKTLILASMALSVAACSSTPEADAEALAQAEEKDDVGLICQKVKVTGSRLPVRKCTTAEERRQEAFRATHTLQGTLGKTQGTGIN